MNSQFSNPQSCTALLKSGVQVTYKLIKRCHGTSVSLSKMELHPQNHTLSPSDIDEILEEIYNSQHSEKIVAITLSSLGLTKIPTRLKSFTNLRLLDCSKNNLTSLNKDLTDLKNLQSLELSYNKIKSLPEEIVLLDKLENLMLSHNRLEKIDFALFGLIRNIEIQNNCFLEATIPRQEQNKFIEQAQLLFNEVSKGTLNLDEYIKNTSREINHLNLYALIRLATLEENKKDLCGGVIDNTNKLFELLYSYFDKVDLFRTRGLHRQLGEMRVRGFCSLKRHLSFSEDSCMEDEEMPRAKKPFCSEYSSQ